MDRRVDFNAELGMEVRMPNKFAIIRPIYDPPIRRSWAERRRSNLVYEMKRQKCAINVSIVILLRIFISVTGLAIGLGLAILVTIIGAGGHAAGFAIAMVIIAYWVFLWDVPTIFLETNPDRIVIKRKGKTY